MWWSAAYDGISGGVIPGLHTRVFLRVAIDETHVQRYFRGIILHTFVDSLTLQSVVEFARPSYAMPGSPVVQGSFKQPTNSRSQAVQLGPGLLWQIESSARSKFRRLWNELMEISWFGMSVMSLFSIYAVNYNVYWAQRVQGNSLDNDIFRN